MSRWDRETEVASSIDDVLFPRAAQGKASLQDTRNLDVGVA